MAISVFHSGVVWVTDTHTEASPPRLPPHEADRVALEEQLKDTRLTRKGDPSSRHPIYNGGCRMTMCFKVNHYTYLNMLCKSLQMHQEGRVLT